MTLEAFGFHFESTEGFESAELKGRCTVKIEERFIRQPHRTRRALA